MGGAGDITVDVRLVAASNRDLETEVREGRFREDLFYRLNVIRIQTAAVKRAQGGHPAPRKRTSSTNTTSSLARK